MKCACIGRPSCIWLMVPALRTRPPTQFLWEPRTPRKEKTDEKRINKQQTNTDTREKHITISQETMYSNSKEKFDEKTQTYKWVLISAGGAPLKNPFGFLRKLDNLGPEAADAMKEFGRGEFKKKAKEWFSSDNKLNKLKDWMKVEDLADASKWLNGENVGNVMDKVDAVKKGVSLVKGLLSKEPADYTKLIKDKAGNYASRLCDALVGTDVNKRASELINKASNYMADDSKPSGRGGAGENQGEGNSELPGLKGGEKSEPAQAGGGGSGQSGGGGGGGGGGLGNIKVGVKAKVEAGAEFTTKSGWQTESIKTVRKSESSGSRSMVSSSTMSELENTLTNSITTIRSTTRMKKQRVQALCTHLFWCWRSWLLGKCLFLS
uniref:Uncharacterized protein n=1 Tax=Ditylenchus dipsaci TaxID=166011 RepID=A0A915CYJ6_9BILA